MEGEFPEAIEKILKEEKYLPEKIFNADKSPLLWGMGGEGAIENIISKEEKQALGFKAERDRLTLLFCANTVGFMIRTTLTYKAIHPKP